MTQRTRNIIALTLIGVSLLMIVTFVAQHFMNPRPAWHKDLVWLALSAAILSGAVRGRRGRHTLPNSD
jgi:hypothetical protein